MQDLISDALDLFSGRLITSKGIGPWIRLYKAPTTRRKKVMSEQNEPKTYKPIILEGVEVKKCRDCDADIYWFTSKRTGRAYPCNVAKVNNEWHTTPVDLHSKTCTRDSNIVM